MNVTEKEALEIARDARTVAVVGMQDEAHSDRPAFTIPAMLQANGVQVIPVNPRIDSSLGVTSLKGLSELQGPPDILDVFRRSETIPELADEILALPAGIRPKVVWLQSGITHPEAEARLEAAGFKVVSDACLGVFAARAR